MSREQDLLFCKIAITSKMVSQEEAQKCLAITNRFEAEGKRRPQVGAVFLKRNLLGDQDVHRIYGAVRKRLDMNPAGARPATPASTAPASTGGASRAAAASKGRTRGPAGVKSAQPRVSPASGQKGSGGRVRRRGKKGSSEVDQKTLVLGIVFGLVAIVCLISIFYLVLRGGQKPPIMPDIQEGIPAAKAG